MYSFLISSYIHSHIRKKMLRQSLRENTHSHVFRMIIKFLYLTLQFHNFDKRYVGEVNPERGKMQKHRHSYFRH